MFKYAAVGTAGALGASARYIITVMVPAESGFPLATLLVNLIGAFLLTFTGFYLFQRIKIPDTLKTAVSIGFLGSFTTFSALSLETVSLLENGRLLTAAAYVLLSISGGVLMSYAGYLCHRLPGSRI